MRGSEMESSVIDDTEPIYDRLRDTGSGSGGPKSPRLPPPHKRSGSQSCQRVKGVTHSKTNRESVLHLADNIMDRGLTQSLPYQPTPMEHRVEEVEMKSPVQISSSFQLPDHKPHTAMPLGPHHRRSNSKDYKKDGSESGRTKPSIEVSGPMTPRGNVSKMAKKFSYSNIQTSPTVKGSRNQPQRQSNTPLKATTSTSEMMKSGIPVMAKAAGEQKIASCGDIQGSPNRNGAKDVQGNGFQRVALRSSDRKNSSNKGRPASLDMTLLLKNEKNMTEYSHEEKSSSNDNILDDSNMEVSSFEERL